MEDALETHTGLAEQSPPTNLIFVHEPTNARGIPMAASNETLLAWLNDAHAMEQQSIDMMEKQVNRLEHYPDLQNAVRSHLETTQKQASRLETAIQKIGGETSTVKQGVAKFMGSVANIVNQSAGDEVVKSGIADYAFEQFEIASYRSLIAAAEHAGKDEIRQICENNLQEEKEMASWLEANLSDVTQQYLQHERAGEPADH